MKKEIAVAAMFVVVITACKKPDPPADHPINYTQLRYDIAKPMQYSPQVGEWRASFSGSRCWLGTAINSSYLYHDFVFDDADDGLKISLSYNAPLSPGDQFDYTLDHQDRSGRSLQTFRMSTVYSALEPSRTVWTFKILSSGTVGTSNWDSTLLVNGNYVLSRSYQTVAAQLEFTVGNPISATEVCATVS